MKQPKKRLDRLLVERGLVDTRSKGQALVMAGEVLVDGEPVIKAGTLVATTAEIEIIAPPPYVSRGGYKLAEALATFAVEARGRICADVGACTGGFTDVLLQNGAKRVYAIDVGYGQLDWKLRQDPRVVVMERTNARHLESLPEQVSLVTIDVSFISLKLILPAVNSWLTSDAHVVALVKPQFEAGPKLVGKGGVVRDPVVHRAVLEQLATWFETNDFGLLGLIRSPIKGSSGNAEFLAWLRPEVPNQLELEALWPLLGLDPNS